jgi:hypothetical protein
MTLDWLTAGDPYISGKLKEKSAWRREGVREREKGREKGIEKRDRALIDE